MVNHMGKYAEHLADRTKLLCGVMQKENQMGLGTPKEKEFREIKSRLISLIILKLSTSPIALL